MRSFLVIPFSQTQTTFLTPLFSEHVPSGLPSPDQVYVEAERDLNAYCIRHAAATYFLRASGNSMCDAGLRDSDLQVVDKSVTPEHGDIVITTIDGEFTVKQLRFRIALRPMDPAYAEIYPDTDALKICKYAERASEKLREKPQFC